MKNKLIKLIATSISASSLCFASEGNILSTAYKHRTLLRNGYHDSKLSSDTFQISFKGNEFTSKQLAIKYALIRAAEVTKNNEALYFVILDKFDDASHHSINYPFFLFYSTSCFDRWVEYLTLVAADSLTTKEPSFTLTIKIFKEKPNTDSYLTASEILEANKDVLNQRKK